MKCTSVKVINQCRLKLTPSQKSKVSKILTVSLHVILKKNPSIVFLNEIMKNIREARVCESSLLFYIIQTFSDHTKVVRCINVLCLLRDFEIFKVIFIIIFLSHMERI